MSLYAPLWVLFSKKLLVRCTPSLRNFRTLSPEESSVFSPASGSAIPCLHICKYFPVRVAILNPILSYVSLRIGTDERFLFLTSFVSANSSSLAQPPSHCQYPLLSSLTFVSWPFLLSTTVRFRKPRSSIHTTIHSSSAPITHQPTQPASPMGHYSSSVLDPNSGQGWMPPVVPNYTHPANRHSAIASPPLASGDYAELSPPNSNPQPDQTSRTGLVP